MWKIVIGFIATVAIVALVGYAIHLIFESKNENRSKYSKSKLPRSWSGPEDLIRQLESIRDFFLHGKPLSNGVHQYSDPMAVIIDKIIKILIRYPEKADMLNGLTEYLIPLAKKFMGDLMFYYNLDMKSEVAQKGIVSCKEGLIYIQAMFSRIADKMLDDINLNIEGELKAFLSLHEVYFSSEVDANYGLNTNEEAQRLHQYVTDFREGKQVQSNARPGIKQVQKGGNGSVQIQIAGNYTGD